MAKNYNRDATQDDGSCEFYYSNIKGCTNPLAKNYDRNATQDDGSCIFEDESKVEKKPKPRLEPIEIIYGCMDVNACNYKQEANEDDNSCNYLDKCGVCGGDNSTCYDCLGVPNGLAKEDKCGICDLNPENDCVQDCLGVWGGAAQIDDCGMCDGKNLSCADCNGVINGDSYKDECGVCDSNLDNDCVQDCLGVWGGSAILDQCNVCNGDNTACIDCLGVINGGAYKDRCGVCDDNRDNDCKRDCKGTWGGDAVLDLCGICNGDNSRCTGCMDEKAANYDEDAKIDDSSLCDYDLVFEESSIKGYTDRVYTKIDMTNYFQFGLDKESFNIDFDGELSQFAIGISFGYEGDIYKKNNLLLSLGSEIMLGQKFYYGNSENAQNFSLNSIYISPIINLPNHKIAIYSRLGLSLLSLVDEEFFLEKFKSFDYGLNIGFGIGFELNDIRFLFDYNYHNIFMRDYNYIEFNDGLINNIGFHRFGLSIYHNLLSNLRNKK